MTDPDDEHQVDLGVTQGELGVARQSLNRALAALQRRGLIDLDAGTLVTIRDPAGLRRLASGDGPVT